MPSEHALSQYDFVLPPALIAHEPVHPRSASRLLVVRRNPWRLTETVFSALPTLLPKDAVLVFNNSKTLPARLKLWDAEKRSFECLMLTPIEDNCWYALCKPTKRLVWHSPLYGTTGEQFATPLRREGNRVVLQCHCDPIAFMQREGQMPLPPYIDPKKRIRSVNDTEAYQTVYAKVDGSAATPTAGLHFTPQLLAQVQEQFQCCEVTLHVGTGTFVPIQSEDIRQHTMHAEWYSVPYAAAQTIQQRQGPLIAVGTTSCRTLEASYRDGNVQAGTGSTSIYLYPGVTLQCTEGLITNFHLPRSSLLTLVATFLGIERWRETYNYAIAKRFRFFSYGDAMLIL